MASTFATAFTHSPATPQKDRVILAEYVALAAGSTERGALGSAGLLRRVRPDPAVDVSEPVEAAHGRESSVDR